MNRSTLFRKSICREAGKREEGVISQVVSTGTVISTPAYAHISATKHNDMHTLVYAPTMNIISDLIGKLGSN